MASPTQRIDKIVAIWNEHMEVAKTLPSLASAIPGAVDLMYSSLAAGGQLLIAGERGFGGGCAAHRR